MNEKIEGIGYTFDDVLIIPRNSTVQPVEVDIRTTVARSVPLNIPILSSPMDTVTESAMSIAMAKYGGLGVIHRNLPIAQQAQEVQRAKKELRWMINHPVVVYPDMPVSQVYDLMAKENFYSMPVVLREGKALVGIVTSRDIRRNVHGASHHSEALVSEIMTRDVVTAKPGVTYEQAVNLLHDHRLERLVVVDDQKHCLGMITLHDLAKCRSSSNMALDGQNLLLVGAAIGVNKYEEERAAALVDAGVNVLVIDTAHGHTAAVRNMIKVVKERFPETPLIAGNIATKEAAHSLIQAGVDGVKVGIGPGSICTTRRVAGVGVPQLSAIMSVKEAIDEVEASSQRACKKVSLIADGGIHTPGDIAKAIVAGADAVMLGSLLAGTVETPGEVITHRGQPYKVYRGMGSTGAMKAGSADRYGQSSRTKLVAEGVEGMVAFKGEVHETLYQLEGGLRAAMGYTGNRTVSELQRHCKFMRITRAGLRESCVHDVFFASSDEQELSNDNGC